MKPTHLYPKRRCHPVALPRREIRDDERMAPGLAVPLEVQVLVAQLVKQLGSPNCSAS